MVLRQPQLVQADCRRPRFCTDRLRGGLLDHPAFVLVAPRCSGRGCFPPIRVLLSRALAMAELQRHSALVRITHWITTFSFVGLIVSGVAILLAHPRLYWGETG